LTVARERCSFYVLVFENIMRTLTLTFKRAKRLRRALTPQEVGLWVRLKNRRLGGFKFRVQHPIGPYILDFYCAEARLAVEIDGDVHQHPDQAAHDWRRDAYFRAMGIETLRLSTALLKEPDRAAEAVLETIRGPNSLSRR
jgi:very-short-patch-repair endonuclease